MTREACHHQMKRVGTHDPSLSGGGGTLMDRMSSHRQKEAGKSPRAWKTSSSPSRLPVSTTSKGPRSPPQAAFSSPSRASSA